MIDPNIKKQEGARKMRNWLRWLLVLCLCVSCLSCPERAFAEDLTGAEEGSFSDPEPEGESCTAVYVGAEVSANGTTMLARCNDSTGENMLTYLRINPASDVPGRVYRGRNGFTYPLPDKTYRYLSIPRPECVTRGEFEACCTNECGLAVTATVTAYASAAAKEADPFVSGGLAEDVIPGILAACCSTAREAAQLAASLVDRYGNTEGSILLMADRQEAWYMELYTGHQYAAVKLPTDKAAVFANDFMLEYREDYPDSISSPGLESLARSWGFAAYDGSGRFSLFGSYAGSSALRDYSARRVWMGQRLLGGTSAGYQLKKYPLCFTPSAPIKPDAVLALYRNRFEGTGFCPEEGADPGVRTISCEWMANAHMVEIYPELPEELACVTWLCLANAECAPFVPFSAAITDGPAAYLLKPENTDYNEDCAFCVYKGLNALCSLNRAALRNGVRDYWLAEDRLYVSLMEGLMDRVRELAEKGALDGARTLLTEAACFFGEESLAAARWLKQETLWYVSGHKNLQRYELDIRYPYQLGNYGLSPFAAAVRPETRLGLSGDGSETARAALLERLTERLEEKAAAEAAEESRAAAEESRRAAEESWASAEAGYEAAAESYRAAEEDWAAERAAYAFAEVFYEAAAESHRAAEEGWAAEKAAYESAEASRAEAARESSVEEPPVGEPPYERNTAKYWAIGGWCLALLCLGLFLKAAFRKGEKA